MTTKKYTAWLFLILIAGCLPALSAHAQTNRMRMTVGGNMQVAKPEVLQLKVTRPKPLTIADKLKAVQSAPGNSAAPTTGFADTVELTPRSGYIDGQAYLDLVNIVGDDYKDSYVVTGPKGIENPVNCNFKPKATGKYLVDLSVRSAYNESVTYEVVAQGEYGQNHMSLSESIPDTNGHITFVYNATDTDWFTVYLNANKQWVFFSCEVTLLK